MDGRITPREMHSWGTHAPGAEQIAQVAALNETVAVDVVLGIG